MESRTGFLIAADAILYFHALFVSFVLFGLLLIFIGKFLHWRWVRNFWLRIAHLAAIVIVVLQSWLGILCPLTVWEMEFRRNAGDSTYSGSFIAHWIQTIMYYDAPAWIFTLLYSLFGSLGVLSWFWIKPRR